MLKRQQRLSCVRQHLDADTHSLTEFLNEQRVLAVYRADAV
jgi:hypothetical protein